VAAGLLMQRARASVLWSSPAVRKRTSPASEKIRNAYPVYRDADLALHDRLNAYWNGRLYFFDRDWKLRWAASMADSDRHLAGLPGLRAAMERTRKEGGT
jgi:hypothetical protein